MVLDIRTSKDNLSLIVGRILSFNLFSGSLFRSDDFWIMGPADYLFPTPLLLDLLDYCKLKIINLHSASA